MSNSHVWLACSSASLLISLVGCGGTAPTTASTTPTRAYTPCENPAQVRLAPTVCFDPVGSTWRVVADAPGGHYDFRIALLAGGRVRSTDHPAAGPGTDEWFVEDDTLRIFLGNRYVEYRGRLQNGSVFIGEASNVRGDTWEFRADRVHEGGQCQVNELVTHAGDEPGCYSAAGSSWTDPGRQSKLRHRTQRERRHRLKRRDRHHARERPLAARGRHAAPLVRRWREHLHRRARPRPSRPTRGTDERTRIRRVHGHGHTLLRPSCPLSFRWRTTTKMMTTTSPRFTT